MTTAWTPSETNLEECAHTHTPRDANLLWTQTASTLCICPILQVLCICQKSVHITHSLRCKYSRVCMPNCEHFNTSTQHYILNLEGPLQFCNVILSFDFFFFLPSQRHWVPIFGEMPIFNFWNSHWADRVDKEGAVRKRAPSTTYSFFWKPRHTGSRWMEGLIWQLTDEPSRWLWWPLRMHWEMRVHTAVLALLIASARHKRTW